MPAQVPVTVTDATVIAGGTSHSVLFGPVQQAGEIHLSARRCCPASRDRTPRRACSDS